MEKEEKGGERGCGMEEEKQEVEEEEDEGTGGRRMKRNKGKAGGR